MCLWLKIISLFFTSSFQFLIRRANQNQNKSLYECSYPERGCRDDASGSRAGFWFWTPCRRSHFCREEAGRTGLTSPELTAGYPSLLVEPVRIGVLPNQIPTEPADWDDSGTIQGHPTRRTLTDVSIKETKFCPDGQRDAEKFLIRGKVTVIPGAATIPAFSNRYRTDVWI